MLRTIVCLAAAPCLAVDQASGYLAVGAGSRSTKFVSHAAIGGQVAVKGPLGVGAEFGAIAGHDSVALASINAYGTLPTSNARIQPFVTAGYTAGLNIAGTEGHYVNAGGGMIYWISRHAGVRFEYWGYARPKPGPIHLFRVGVSFR